MEKFAERLKELRIEKGFTQRQLAKEVGLSQSAIRQWESELREPSGNAIIVLAKYFKVSTDYLFGLED